MRTSVNGRQRSCARLEIQNRLHRMYGETERAECALSGDSRRRRGRSSSRALQVLRNSPLLLLVLLPLRHLQSYSLSSSIAPSVSLGVLLRLVVCVLECSLALSEVAPSVVQTEGASRRKAAVGPRTARQH